MSHLLTTALIGILFAGALPAQLATYTYINQQAPYSNPPTASFTANNVPRIGSNFELVVPMSWSQRNRTGANFTLATGLLNPNLAIPALGGYLYTLPLVMMNTPMSPIGIPATTRLRIPIPNSVALIGLRFYQQILETPNVNSSTPVRLSRAGQGMIGR
jgi:hypothetical protein